MYSGSGFSEWEIGDLAVIIHNGIYRLFHLIIPNHDYIAPCYLKRWNLMSSVVSLQSSVVQVLSDPEDEYANPIEMSPAGKNN
jgi:hypothetical protein